MRLVRRVVGAVRAFFHAERTRALGLRVAVLGLIPLVVVERARVRRLLSPDVRRKLRQQGGELFFQTVYVKILPSQGAGMQSKKFSWFLA